MVFSCIAQSFLRPNVVSFLDTAATHLGIALKIAEIHRRPRIDICRQNDRELADSAQDQGVIVLANTRREGLRIKPAPDERIEVDHCLIAMGQPSQLCQLEQTAASTS